MLFRSAQLNRRMLANHTPDQLLGFSARNALILAALLLVFAVTQIGGVWAFMALLFFMVGSIAPVQANTMAGGLARADLRAGSAAALFGAATFAGGAIASWIAGSLYDGTARGLSVVVAAGMIGLALAIRFIVLRPRPAAI